MVWQVLAGPVVSSIFGTSLRGIFGNTPRRGPSIVGRLALAGLQTRNRPGGPSIQPPPTGDGGAQPPSEPPIDSPAPPSAGIPDNGPLPGFVIPGVPRPPITSPPVWSPPPVTRPVDVPVTPRAVPLPNLPNVPWTRVLSRVLGIPGLILWPSTTADDDTIPDDYPYPERVKPPKQAPPLDLPEWPIERPVIEPPPRYFPQPKIPAPAPERQPDPVRYRPPRPQIPGVQPIPRVPISRPEPVRIPTPAPSPAPTPSPTPGRPTWPYALPWYWPSPVARPVPRLPLRFPAPGTSPQPTLPGGLTTPQTQVRPSTQPQPQASQCPPCKPRDCEQVKRRRRKKGQCRQGYFREYPDRTEYITWSRRKCL